jgi:hypothetical protein
MTWALLCCSEIFGGFFPCAIFLANTSQFASVDCDHEYVHWPFEYLIKMTICRPCIHQLWQWPAVLYPPRKTMTMTCHCIAYPSSMTMTCYPISIKYEYAQYHVHDLCPKPVNTSIKHGHDRDLPLNIYQAWPWPVFVHPSGISTTFTCHNTRQ